MTNSTLSIYQHGRNICSLDLDLEEDSGEVSPRDVWTQYTTYTARLESFIGWPSKYYTQSIETLAYCGFFYTGCADKVTCFSCNKTVRNWKSGEDPYVKHLKVSPRCIFLQSLHYETSPLNQESSSGTAVSGCLTRTNHHDPVVRKVIEMGFSEDDVATVMTEADGTWRASFDVAELVEAIIVLEGRLNRNHWSRVNQSNALSNESTVSMNLPESNVNSHPATITSYFMAQGQHDAIADIIEPMDVSECGAQNNLTKNEQCNTSSTGILRRQNDDVANLTETMALLECGEQNRFNERAQCNTSSTIKPNHDNNQCLDNKSSKNAIHEQSNNDRFVDKIKRENLQLKCQRTCRKCRKEPAVVLALPCGHIASCVECVNKTNTCFVCSKQILGTVRTYLA